MSLLNGINFNSYLELAKVDLFFNKIGEFKKSYSQINQFLHFGEVLSPPEVALSFGKPKNILKEQLGLFAIPGFIGSTLRFSNTISKLQASSINKIERVKESIIPSLRYIQSCSAFLQYLSTMRFVDLKNLGASLPGITVVTRLILSIHSFCVQIQRQSHSFSPTRNEGFLFFKNLLDLYSALFCLIVFFFSLSTSPYWILTATGFLLVSALMDKLLKFILD